MIGPSRPALLVFSNSGSSNSGSIGGVPIAGELGGEVSGEESLASSRFDGKEDSVADKSDGLALLSR